MLQVKRFAPLLLIGGLVFGLMFWLSRSGERVAETPVKVACARPGVELGLVVVPQAAVAEGEAPFVARLRHLRAERVPVRVEAAEGGQLAVRSAALRPGDLLVLGPADLAAGEAVAPMAGVDDERLVALVLEAAMHAVESEDLPESVRFVSPGYKDAWGYNIALLRQVFKRSFREFDNLRFELAAPPVINVDGGQALVQTQVRLKADYRGRRNYLLGGEAAPNRVLLRLDKRAYGWKVARIEGLRPLDFEERFFRLLGREVGLPLSEEERLDRDRTCARCKERMNERFGPAAPPGHGRLTGPLPPA